MQTPNVDVNRKQKEKQKMKKIEIKKKSRGRDSIESINTKSFPFSSIFL